MATWNTAFEQTPAGSETPSLGDDRFRELKGAVRERLEKEHTMDLTGGIAGDDGWHESGSAKVYFQSAAPTTRPDGTTSLTAADNGRIWISSTDYKLRVYNHAAGATVADRWVIQNDEFPVGLIVPFAGEVASVPTGWLPCTGGAVSRTDYASLHTILKDVGGTNAYGWGAGDGSTTFNLPDLRELYLVGVGTRAAGITAHDAFNLAQMKDDQMQGHFHSVPTTTAGTTATAVAQGSASAAGTASTGAPTTDGVNGTPRTGAVTRGKGAGVNYIIKARTADPNYTVESASLDARTTLLEGLGFSLRNALDNGDFAIDQRTGGGSKTLTAGTTRIMTVDRWYGYSTTAAASAQRVTGSTRRFGLKITGAASNAGVTVGQNIQAPNAARFKGKKAYLSIVGFADAARNVTWTVKSMQSTDVVGTPVVVATGTLALTTTPTRFSVTFEGGANAANGYVVEFSVAALGAGQYIQFEQAQLEQNSVATVFEERPYPVELMLCQWFTKVLSGTNAVFCNGAAYSNVYTVVVPGEMRLAQPAVTTVGTINFNPTSAAAAIAISTISASAASGTVALTGALASSIATPTAGVLQSSGAGAVILDCEYP